MTEAPIDIFLSHGSPDKPWVRTLAEELNRRGLSVFLDEQALKPGDNFVLGLSDALRQSRAFVLVLSRDTIRRPWVEREWTSYMAEHGPRQRIVPVILEQAELPTFLKPIQALPALDRDAVRVAEVLAYVLSAEGQDRRLYLGQELSFFIRQAEAEDGALDIMGPDGKPRTVIPPWKQSRDFGVAWLGYRQLTREPAETDTQREELFRHARTLGRLLFETLFASEQDLALLKEATPAGGDRPLVSIRSDDDFLLSLPWELLCHEDRFLVRDGVVDLARSTANEVGMISLLREPSEPFRLVTNVSAPAGSGLSYEAESYRITRALSDRCPQTPTELGTLSDFVATVASKNPIGVHFSGHGAAGHLVFEDDLGQKDIVPIGKLVEELKNQVPGGRLPPFFYLASCHGNTPASTEERASGAESSAAQLHHAGVAQVVGYYGPIADELSTRAEEALYSAIAAGETTRTAVRRALRAMMAPFDEVDASHRPDGKAAGLESSPQRSAATEAPNRSHPFAWAQLVFYHRGPDLPLGTAVKKADISRREEALQRSFTQIGSRRVLSTGFIGRRAELHRIRQRIRRGDRVFVLQGLGGLGKTTLAGKMVRMLAKPEGVCAIWCQEAEDHDNPPEALVGQLLDYCRKRFGPGWESVVSEVDQIAEDDSVKRFALFLRALVENATDPLVLYLDNLESLLVGPPKTSREEPPDEGAFGAWRSKELAAMWQILTDLANGNDKLRVVASCRYRNPDFESARIPVAPLPKDALFRLMAWFPALRRLSTSARAHLVTRLAGHPRAVEFTNDLVRSALAGWESEHGSWTAPDSRDQEACEWEWAGVVESVLPTVQDQLWEDLLLGSIWENVLDDRARRMLFRMTLQRRPWERDLAPHLGETEETEDAAVGTADNLGATSLLEQVELLVEADDQLVTKRYFTLHPATVAFVKDAFGTDEALVRETHRRVGEFLEGKCQGQRIDLRDALEAGHHLFHAGEYDRSFEILGGASDWLQGRGRVREGLQILMLFLVESVRSCMRKELAVRLLGTVGVACHRLGQTEKAIEHYAQSLVISREIGDQHGEGANLGNLGLVYANLGQAEKAIEHHEQALVISREIGDRRGEGSDLGNLGSAYANLGQLEKAIEHHEQALAIQREIGDRQGEGNALGNLGIAYRNLGQLEKAIEHHEQALVISREIGDRRGEGSDLGNLGTAYANLGQLEKAIEHHEQALVISREIGDRQGEGNALGNLGVAYRNLGQLEKAIEHHEQALVISREIGNRRGEGNSLGNLGIAYADLGQVEKAIEHYEQQLPIVREIGDRRGEGASLGNLGNAYAGLDQVEKAIEHYGKQLSIVREIGDRRGEGSALGNLGNVYASLGQVEKAIELTQQALQIGQEISDPQIIEATSSLLRKLAGAEDQETQSDSDE